MGNAKITKIRDLMPATQAVAGAFSKYAEFMALLMNALKITKRNGEALPFNLETFIKKSLLERGRVGFDKIADVWAFVDGVGVNDLGDALSLKFSTASTRGKQWTRNACYDDDPDGAYMVKALPFDGVTFADIVYSVSCFMANCDVAISQNVEACKTPYIIKVKNKNALASFRRALEIKALGQAVVMVDEELGDGLQSVNIGVPFLADKFREESDKARDALLNKLGIMTANTNKKERVQSAEVNATLGVASDYVYLLIDTFNKQAETFGIDAEMSYNGSMEEIYLGDESEGVNNE